MIPGIQVSKSEITIPKQTQKDLPFWGPGKKQELTAKVLERLGPDQAKLLINGKEVTVNTKLALSPGEEILLNVTREKGEVGFKLAGPFRNMESPDPPSLFKFFTGKMVPARILKADASN